MFNGKAIYNPSGKAGEYSYWACNFYVGCSNGCEYCYCKKGILAGAMGQDKPQLKKCFRDKKHALEVFRKELKENLEDLRKHGLFFSFTTDPMLPETIYLTMMAMLQALRYDVPVKILTKNAEFENYSMFKAAGFFEFTSITKSLIAMGVTLTGHDELEPGASSNAERIRILKLFSSEGFRTFASIEPVVDFESSLFMIRSAAGYCDLFKVGLMSGAKYDKKDLRKFINDVIDHAFVFDAKVYFKDSLLKTAGISRESLPAHCVTRDYNIFNG